MIKTHFLETVNQRVIEYKCYIALLHRTEQGSVSRGGARVYSTKC